MQTVQSEDLETGFTPGNAWGVGCCLVLELQGPTKGLSAGSDGHGGFYGSLAWIDSIAGRAHLLMIQGVISKMLMVRRCEGSTPNAWLL